MLNNFACDSKFALYYIKLDVLVSCHLFSLSLSWFPFSFTEDTLHVKLVDGEGKSMFIAILLVFHLFEEVSILTRFTGYSDSIILFYQTIETTMAEE